MAKTYVRFIVGVMTIVCFVVRPDMALASILYLTPTSADLNIHETIDVRVTLDTQQEEVNGVAAYLSYPHDALEVTHINEGSAFTITGNKSTQKGVIEIARASIEPVKGTVHVATIGFKAKKAGKALLLFSAGSAVPRYSDSSDSLLLASSRGSSLTIAEQEVISPTGQDKTPPVLGEISIENIATNSATIQWATDEPADSQVEFGVESAPAIFKAIDSALTTDHLVTLDTSSLLPGMETYYIVKSRDGSGNETVSDIGSLRLQGYDVKIVVTGQDGQPLPGVQVALDREPDRKTTDASGQVAFEDIVRGGRIVTLQYGDSEQKEEIVVADTNRFHDPQEFFLSYETGLFSNSLPSQDSMLKLAIGILILLFLAGVAFFIKKARKVKT